MATQGLPLEISCYHSAGTVVLRVSGQVDLNTVPVLQGELTSGLRVVQDDSLVIDTTELEFVHSRGVSPTPPTNTRGESHSVRVIPQAGPIDARVIELLELGSLLAAVAPAKETNANGKTRATSSRDAVRDARRPVKRARGGPPRSVKTTT